MDNILKFKKLSSEAFSPEYSYSGYIIRSPQSHIIPPNDEKEYILKTNLSLYLPVSHSVFRCCCVIHPLNELKRSIYIKSEIMDPTIELRCKIINNSNSDYIIERGDKVFQIIINIIITPPLIEI